MSTATQKRIVKTFEQQGDFAACYAAQDWCNENGISVGEMQRNAPRGLMYGDWNIDKWRNLSANDQKDLHGTMTGDMRNGPVVVNIRERKEGEHGL